MPIKSTAGFRPAIVLDPTTFHRITKIDTDAKTGVCSQCGPTRILSGKGAYVSWRCRTVYNERRRTSGYRRFLGDSCERCGFVPEDTCQLDVDHIDNNRNNNDESNLMTLCSNCHRLKSRLVALDRSEEWTVPLKPSPNHSE